MQLKNKTSNYESILEEYNELTYISYGYSMYPLIKQKEDILHIIKIDRKLKKQDVVLYKDKEHHYVLHRILKIKKNNVYILAGDHNFFKDKPIDESCIIGRLKDITKKDGTIIDLDKDKRIKGWFYIHFFYLKSLYLGSIYFLKKIFKK